jgi:hypothetical protein
LRKRSARAINGTNDSFNNWQNKRRRWILQGNPPARLPGANGSDVKTVYQATTASVRQHQHTPLCVNGTAAQGRRGYCGHPKTRARPIRPAAVQTTQEWEMADDPVT